MAQLNELLGKILTSVIAFGDEVVFTCEDGKQYRLYHEQYCCEGVFIDDINGDLQDLVGSPITLAEEVSNEQFEKDWEQDLRNSDNYFPESHTWTFYKFATVKGYVDIRWFGRSNGYYSESVDFCQVGKNRWED